MRRQQGKEQDVRFEPADVPAFLPLWLAAGLASFVIIVLVGSTIGYPLADEQQYRGPMQALPPGPRLQLTPGQDLEAYQAAKRREFQGSNSAIEAAMHSTAKQGWGPPR
jgi:hypothetical protein